MILNVYLSFFTSQFCRSFRILLSILSITEWPTFYINTNKLLTSIEQEHIILKVNVGPFVIGNTNN